MSQFEAELQIIDAKRAGTFLALGHANMKLPTRNSLMSEIWQCLDSRSIGGIETHVHTLSKELSRRGYKVRVIFLQHYGKHPLISRLRKTRLSFHVCAGVQDFLRQVRRERPALIHTHGYKANIVGRLAGLLNAIPAVSTFHAGEPGEGRVRLYNAIDRVTSLYQSKLAVSEEIHHTLPGKATLLQNFVAVPVSLANLANNRIAFVGRLSHEKGPDIFCEMADRFPNASFDVYGDGPMKVELQAKYGAAVTFHGMVPDVSLLLQHSSLLVMPSRYEGLPMAALEAMAQGVPVAAFAVGGLPNLIEDGRNGFLAHPDNAAELAESIGKYLSLDTAARLAVGAAASRKVAAQFSPDIQIPKLTEIYRNALSTGAGGHAFAA